MAYFQNLKTPEGLSFRLKLSTVMSLRRSLFLHSWVQLNRTVLLTTFLFGIIPLSTWAQPSSLTDLVAAYRTAMQEKSVEKLSAITYTVGQSESDKKQVATAQQMAFNWSHKEVRKVSPEPLPADFQSVFIVNGKKIEPTYVPLGVIKVEYTGTGAGPDSSSAPYASIDGHYFLISSKTTDLGWKGPPDTGLCLMVTGSPQDKVQIAVKWNASGVDQEKIFNKYTTTVIGQYVESATVTSSNPEATLMILQGDKQIFLSPPLKGKAAIEYKKN
jgi:hypothetical protein